MPSQHKIIINTTSDPWQFRILNFNWSIKKKNRIKNKKHMNLDLTSSSSRTQKSTTQKKSYKPKKSKTKNTRKSNISIHFPPPKASHNLSSKKKSCNQSISQPKIIRAPPSPLQVGKISNPTILARVSDEFSCASSTVFFIFFPN